MTELQFFYWLQGYFEISAQRTFNKDKAVIAERHCALVRKHAPLSKPVSASFAKIETLLQLAAVRGIDVGEELRDVLAGCFENVTAEPNVVAAIARTAFSEGGTRLC